MALMTNERRTASIITKTEVTTLTISKEVINMIYTEEDGQKVKEHLEKMLRDRLWELHTIDQKEFLNENK